MLEATGSQGAPFADVLERGRMIHRRVEIQNGGGCDREYAGGTKP
jgi:hypothetical protein